MFTLLYMVSCVEKPYPVYNLTPDEKKWLAYKTNDTLVYEDSIGNKAKFKVNVFKEGMFKIKTNPYAMFTPNYTKAEVFSSMYQIFSLNDYSVGGFPGLIYIDYDKDERGFILNVMFGDMKKIDTLKFRDTTILNRKFTNCIFFYENTKEIGYDKMRVTTVYSRDKGIVAWNNSKNEVFVLVNR